MQETRLPDSYFKEPGASELARKRISARLNHRRLTYDCLNAKVSGDSVLCPKRKFSKVGGRLREGMSLSSVLRGRSSAVCQICGDYDGEESE